MSRGKVIFLVIVVAIALMAVAAASVLHDGLSSRARPSGLETMMARNARRMAMPASAGKLQNPATNTPENLRDARLHFADHCAICHANDGSGDTMMGHNLYPKPPDLRLEQTQKLVDGEIFWIIENGVRFTGMPAFGGAHGSEEDSWKLVRFIRHLPQLTAEERLEMERYNPKGPRDVEEEQEENDFLRGAPMQQKPEGTHHH
ncbi:MAG TPA: cytochrome c [Candidatus Saccharimonadales bacterium]|jgi:mono/diheme cytochrome c family protein|nr:cytochrome c [Candidatus Saccharimonadales bacterium]